MLTFDSVTQILKEEFSLADLHFMLGPDSTHESLLEEGGDFLGKLMRGEVEVEEVNFYDEDF